MCHDPDLYHVLHLIGLQPVHAVQRLVLAVVQIDESAPLPVEAPVGALEYAQHRSAQRAVFAPLRPSSRPAWADVRGPVAVHPKQQPRPLRLAGAPLPSSGRSVSPSRPDFTAHRVRRGIVQALAIVTLLESIVSNQASRIPSNGVRVLFRATVAVR